MFVGFDCLFVFIVFLLLCVGIVMLYSVLIDVLGCVEDQLCNILLMFVLMWVIVNILLIMLMCFVVLFYMFGVMLLIVVVLFGMIKKGVKCWLNVGVVIQLFEIFKIVMLLMFVWYYQCCEGGLCWYDFIVVFGILLVLVGLIVKQLDFGMGLFVFVVGFFVIYFVGLLFKLIVLVFVVGVIVVGLIVVFEECICQFEVQWLLMYDYQKYWVCMLFDLMFDLFGKGFYMIQVVIVIGLGGVFGKGYLKGMQVYFEFILEKYIDFIFVVFLEEWGFVGGFVLLMLYMVLIVCGFYIVVQGVMLFGWLFVGLFMFVFFVYVFVNIGMVSGVLLVVGVLLLFMSYGGIVFIMFGIVIGMIMSVGWQWWLMKS